jgi:hypothetical protein
MAADPEFWLNRDGAASPVHSLDELQARALPALGGSSGYVVLELRTPARPAWWERVIYPLLGLALPAPPTRLALYTNGRAVLATFEQREQEWVVTGRAVEDAELVRLQTEGGEAFEVAASECVPNTIAVELLREFFVNRRRPTVVQWTRRA